MTLRMFRSPRLIDWPNEDSIARDIKRSPANDSDVHLNPVIDLNEFSMFQGGESVTFVADACGAFSNFCDHMAELHASAVRASEPLDAPNLILPKTGRVDATAIAILDAAALNFTVDQTGQTSAKRIAINPNDRILPPNDGGGFAGVWVDKYLSTTLPESILSEWCRLKIVTSVSETVSNALHGDGFDNEFCCVSGQGRQWSLAIVARLTGQGAEIAYSVVTGGATIAATMFRKSHASVGTEIFRSLRPLLIGRTRKLWRRI